jgi:plasmid stabilization system protein ParE
LLDWSRRALADVDGIFIFYAETASVLVAADVRVAIENAATTLSLNPLAYRSGRTGTREFVMSRYPFTLIYRISSDRITVVRVLHQAREYFNRDEQA